MPNGKARLERLRESVRLACERGAHGMEVEMITWPMAAGDVGHTALRLGDLVLGYYPTDLNNDGEYGKKDLHDSPGELHVDTVAEAKRLYAGDSICVSSLAVSCETLLCLIDWYLAVLNNLGTYSLLNRNCTTIPADALAACGLDLTATIDYPASGYGDLLLTTRGNVTIVEPGICTHTIQFDHGSVVSPNNMKGRIKDKDYVTSTREEVVR